MSEQTVEASVGGCVDDSWSAIARVDQLCITARHQVARLQRSDVERRLDVTRHTLEVEELRRRLRELAQLENELGDEARRRGQAGDVDWLYYQHAPKLESEMRDWAYEYVLRKLRAGEIPQRMQPLQEIRQRYESVDAHYLRAELEEPSLRYVLGFYERGEDPTELSVFRSLLVRFRELVGRDPDKVTTSTQDDDDLPF